MQLFEVGAIEKTTDNPISIQRLVTIDIYPSHAFTALLTEGQPSVLEKMSCCW